MSQPTHNRVLVTEIERGVKRPLVKTNPEKSSGELGFQGFLLERHRLRELENIDVACTQTLLGLHLSAPLKAEVRDDGPFRQRVYSPGDLTLFPAGARFSCRFKGETEFLLLSLNDELLNSAVEAVTERGTASLRLNWGFRDSLIRETLLNLRDICDSQRRLDRVYAESLANTLALHLVRNSRQIDGHFGGTTRGLSRAQLGRTLDFIHNTPFADISLNAMADAAGLSPFHFSRMFKVATGHSPHQYVLRRRIDIGAEMLLSRNDSVASIALELGFADQSHFTMHFKRVHGVGPASYRRHHGR